MKWLFNALIILASVISLSVCAETSLHPSVEHLRVLTGPDMQGRGAGSSGDKVATEYIEQVFARNHLVPLGDNGTYRQNFYIKARAVKHAVKPQNILENQGVGGGRLLLNNLIGLLPAHSVQKDITLVVAHYDHLGIQKGEVHPGADDNASGVSLLLALLDSLPANGHKELGNIIFIAFAAEEYGLKGAKYLVNNPTFDLSAVKAVINVEMMGRTDSRNSDKDPYVYTIGSNLHSDMLAQLVQDAGSNTNIDVDRYYERRDRVRNLYRRSDHWEFAKLGIPSLLLFGGLHQDYHKQSDTFENIDQDLLSNRFEFIKELVLKVADSKVKLPVTNRRPRWFSP